MKHFSFNLSGIIPIYSSFAFILVLLMLSITTYADEWIPYSFSSTTMDGQTLYFDIESDSTCSLTAASKQKNDNGYISYHSDYSGCIDIPSQVNYKGKSYKVIAIGKGAFQSSDVECVYIPYSVLGIGSTAFLVHQN